MQTFEVRFTWQGRRYTEHVTCNGPTAARRAIEARYPGATTFSIRRISG